ncbi:MAG TPA: hypothetical protein VK498_11740 [Ferruginibacter sp.]|nr:hypothetical protein [Ferruginibacter sp.]
MPRILPADSMDASSEIKQAYEQHITAYNARITNMKATLAHSEVAFKAYMEWYPMYEEVKKILGPRLSSLFAWSVSEASDCPLCSTYFRKIIIESGEDPGALVLSGNDQQVVSFGAMIAQNKGFIPDEIYKPLSERFSDKEIVVLTAFAGIMIATNIFNNLIHTDIDEYLIPFKAKG